MNMMKLNFTIKIELLDSLKEKESTMNKYL